MGALSSNGDRRPTRFAAAGCPRRWMQVLMGAVLLAAQPTERAHDERHIKALFLFNFAKFVEWPSDLPAGPICIAVVDDEAFAGHLEQIVSGKKVNGQGLIVRRVTADSPPKDCHMVFVSGGDAGRSAVILGTLKGASVLTVGESPGFAEAGGVINFEIVNNRVRFEVNVDAAERARLKLSSKLLSLAIIVREAGG